MTDTNTGQAEDDPIRKRNRAKMGDYENPENGCPNCARFRIMRGDDAKHRCEKCGWCVEDENYDLEFQRYLFGG